MTLYSKVLYALPDKTTTNLDYLTSAISLVLQVAQDALIKAIYKANLEDYPQL